MSTIFALPLLSGCWGPSPTEVIVYSALDEEFAAPVLAEFQRQHGIQPQAVYDIESSKTVGLVERILAEADRPRCDVFWNNEILHTLRLEKRGLLEVYRSPAGELFPAMFRSPHGTWHGFAARARVLIVNTDRVPADERPTSIHDLTNPRWKSSAGIARPLFGTTATHAACLFAALGNQKAREFFRHIQANDVHIVSGNKQVAQDVAAGKLAFGLTDTDDAIIEQRAGRPVVIVYPDQGPGQLGTLFIPNTIAIVRGAANPDQARKLVDYLLSPEVERRLAEGASAQIPLNPKVDAQTQVATPATVRAMQVDFAQAAEAWETAAEFLWQEFAVRR